MTVNCAGAWSELYVMIFYRNHKTIFVHLQYKFNRNVVKKCLHCLPFNSPHLYHLTLGHWVLTTYLFWQMKVPWKKRITIPSWWTLKCSRLIFNDLITLWWISCWMIIIIIMIIIIVIIKMMMMMMMMMMMIMMMTMMITINVIPS